MKQLFARRSGYAPIASENRYGLSLKSDKIGAKIAGRDQQVMF